LRDAGKAALNLSGHGKVIRNLLSWAADPTDYLIHCNFSTVPSYAQEGSIHRRRQFDYGFVSLELQ
jgi:hypothetical protein